MKTKDTDTGVIVARFQTHKLHEAHVDLIRTVCEKHDKVIIFLGLSPLKTTQNNPLDFESRKQMILEKFPKVNVLYIKDNPSDYIWSKKLDESIKDLLGPTQTATLYGGRDSFITHYHGNFPTTELIPESYVSGTEMRKSISRTVMNSEQFRAGIVFATHNQYPVVIPTVDIAILNEGLTKLLLGRKDDEKQFRFIGGFSEPQYDSYEQNARREVMEETGIEIGELKYLGSTKIDDWRFRGETNQIVTLFYMAVSLFGAARASDDICEVKWFELKDLKPEQIVDCHLPLFNMLMKHLKETLPFTSFQGEKS